MTDFGARFLHEPSLFPRRLSGEVWGAEQVSIELAGERYRVEGLSPAQAASLRARYGPRLTPGDASEPAVTFRIFRAPRSDFRDIDTRGWEYSLDLDWSGEAVAMAGMRLMARADLSSMHAGLWTCVDDRDEFWGLLENVLRPVLAARLLEHGGLLVHSAAVDGCLFPSPSGGGKSTLAGLALRAGQPVLSDDLNAAVRTEGGWMLVPLPFTGDLAEEQLSTIPQPLRAVVGLEKGPREQLRNMPLADAVSLLVRCAPYVNQDPHRTTALVERAAELGGSAKRAVLTFRVAGEVWPILDGLR
ncbi:MAG: hypothetical protein ABI779_09660 [Acidobacteriota bacterium]